MISAFGKHFIKTDIFPREMGRALNMAFEKRQKGMNWEIKYKKDAWKFISKNKLIDKFEATIKMFIKGEGRIDLKKLAGKLV